MSKTDFYICVCIFSFEAVGATDIVDKNCICLCFCVCLMQLGTTDIVHGTFLARLSSLCSVPHRISTHQHMLMIIRIFMVIMVMMTVMMLMMTMRASSVYSVLCQIFTQLVVIFWPQTQHKCRKTGPAKDRELNIETASSSSLRSRKEHNMDKITIAG